MGASGLSLGPEKQPRQFNDVSRPDSIHTSSPVDKPQKCCEAIQDAGVTPMVDTARRGEKSTEDHDERPDDPRRRSLAFTTEDFQAVVEVVGNSRREAEMLLLLLDADLYPRLRGRPDSQKDTPMQAGS